MSEYYRDEQATLLLGDAQEELRTLPDGSVDCIVTSPPYWGLRDYGVDGQLGWEATHQEYVEAICQVFDEIARVMKQSGTAWLNIGDRYSSRSDGFKRGTNRKTRQPLVRPAAPDVLPKSLIGLPWRVAFALHDRGWVIRNSIIWSKPASAPGNVADRYDTSHEVLFLLTRHRYYHFDPTQLHASPGDVWTLPVESQQGRHEAPFPEALPWRCITAGCPEGGTVLDPFSGSGTTGDAARKLGRRYIGIDLNPTYHALAQQRFAQGVLDFNAA